MDGVHRAGDEAITLSRRKLLMTDSDSNNGDQKADDGGKKADNIFDVLPKAAFESARSLAEEGWEPVFAFGYAYAHRALHFVEDYYKAYGKQAKKDPAAAVEPVLTGNSWHDMQSDNSYMTLVTLVITDLLPRLDTLNWLPSTRQEAALYMATMGAV
eukprot:gene5010-6103_t